MGLASHAPNNQYRWGLPFDARGLVWKPEACRFLGRPPSRARTDSLRYWVRWMRDGLTWSAAVEPAAEPMFRPYQGGRENHAETRNRSKMITQSAGENELKFPSLLSEQNEFQATRALPASNGLTHSVKLQGN